MARSPLFPILVCLLLSGCQSPLLVFPGKQLQGETAQAENFEFAADYRLLTLEVNPDDPYSVYLRATVIDGQLYIDAAPARRWGRHIASNREVRIKLGTKIYPAIADSVSDPDILSSFLNGRAVYRITPR
jgi:hypothetical protein